MITQREADQAIDVVLESLRRPEPYPQGVLDTLNHFTKKDLVVVAFQLFQRLHRAEDT